MTKLHESPKTIVYRGHRIAGDRQPVIVKLLNRPYSNALELARFEREYEIASRIDESGIVRCIGLERIDGRPAILFRDILGISLNRIGRIHRLETAALLELAIQTARALGRIHRLGIIHKDINPSNIVWNRRTGEMNIIDFGISSELARETPQAANPDGLEGTLPYISPEQTGRVNRSLDYRTDMYSLGVTLYELLTGMLPFDTSDSLELVHAHIAKTPAPPHEFRPDLPAALFEIVRKLMAKNAEDRYQSADGVAADLAHCLEEIRRHGSVAPFALGRKDRSDKFTIPQRLYGRQSETKALLEAYDRVCKGGPELVLVTGYPGIGKTVLIREIEHQPALDRGYFISGKFEQYKRNIPYSCLFDAFAELVRQLLAESGERIGLWRDEILEVVGGNGQLLVDHIPDLELIIGRQPPVRELPLAEARNRFHLIFQEFIRIFTRQAFPLVIFLDDLQWADSATLSLLQLFLSDPENRSLLIIGAFRDNAVEAHHPLMLTLAEIEKTAAPVSRIALEPLDADAINRMVADTLHTDPGETVDLSGQISRKAGGNPFFIREFLKTLYQEGAIAFDHRLGGWTWDIDVLRKIGVTDNVVDLMTRKIRTLEPRTIELLTEAACIGNRFSIDTLAWVGNRDTRRTLEALLPAIEEELVVPLDPEPRPLLMDTEPREDGLSCRPARFGFLHDRVQQATYQLLSGEKARAIHLRIGRVLLEKSGRQQMEEQLFDIVNQFNLGLDLVEEIHEIRMLARLNLKAGQKARNSAAYDTALVYFSTGLNLLPDDSWRTDYDLAYSLSMGCAECEYLNGFIAKSEARFRLILENVHTDLEKVQVYQIIARIYQNLGKYRDAVGIGITALELLKIRIPLNPGMDAVLAKMLKIRLRLRRRDAEFLRQLPELQDRYVLAILDTLSGIGAASFLYSRSSAVYINLTMLELTLKYGNSCHSPFIYSIYALILCSGAGAYRTGYEYGRIALSMLEHTEDRDTACKARFIFARGVNHWGRNARTSLELYRTAYTDGIASGNLVYAGWSALYIIVVSIITGVRTDDVTGEIRTYSRFMKRIKYGDILHFCVLPERFIGALKGETADISEFGGPDFDEAVYVRQMEAECQFTPAIVWYYIMKIQACYLAGLYETGLELSVGPRNHLEELRGTLLIPEYHFYCALCIAGACHSSDGRKRKRLLRRLRAIRRKFRRWAAECEANFLHKYLLICAEIARITGNCNSAESFYRRSIKSAHDSGYLQNEAIAGECAARFFLAQENREAARTHILNAQLAYLKWGATAKAFQLESAFSAVCEPAATHAVQKTASPTSRISSETLDWRTLVKALQAISREINLSALIETLMRIAIENAGAQRGVLILVEGDRLLIEAESRADGSEILKTRSVPLAQGAELPVSLIQYTVRKKEPVILEDAGGRHPFSDDPYFRNHRKRSVLSHPIIHQGKPIGILYLENDHAPNIFTPDRAQVLDLLSAQAAVSLENARLYTRLKNSERKYRSIFENAVEGMFQISEDGGFISANIAMADILGFESPEELMDVSESAANLFFADEKNRRAFSELLWETGHVAGFEGMSRRRDGSEFWTSVSARAVFDDQDGLLYYEGTLVDITERKEREWAERQRKAAEAIAQSKNVFLANMSHEIRTPLNAITGLTELVLMTDLDHKQRDFLNKIKTSSDSLLRIIDDILQYSRIEAGRLELETADFKLSSVFEKIEILFSTPMSEKGIEMILSVSDDAPSMLNGDALRLGQVLINLVSNALKFTEAGEIVIGAKPVRRDADIIRMQFFVSDSGIGIAEADISRLFDAFVQADGSITRRYGGTGLGLAICKNIVELMNGAIWAERNEKQGSSFYFEVDLGYAGTAEQQRLPEDLAGRKAIVVDDNPVSRTLLVRQLQNLGLEVTSCDSGEAALELFGPDRQQPHADLVVMDWKLPGLDGIETIRRIRLACAENHPLFILITAFGWEAAQLEIKAEDADAFLTKPVHPAKLAETVTALFHPEEQKTEAPETKESETLPADPLQRDIRLLLVDDNAINREITTEILQQSGYDVDAAEDGKRAIAAVERRPYDAVLMDIQMPGMDGYEATRIIRADPRNRDLVIIAMTAHAMEGYRGRCLEAGMNDYITKPVDLGRLHELLAEYTGSGPIPPESRCPANRTEPDSSGRFPGLDTDSAIRRLGGNRKLYISMIRALCSQYGDVVRVLNEALAEGLFEKIERTSHTLKGLAGNIGAQELRLSAMALSRSVKSGNVGEIRSAMKKLADAVDATMPMLRQLAAEAGPLLTHEAASALETDGDEATAVMELDRLLAEGHSAARSYFESIRGRLARTDLRRHLPQLAMHIENYDYTEARQIIEAYGFRLDLPMEGKA